MAQEETSPGGGAAAEERRAEVAADAPATPEPQAPTIEVPSIKAQQSEPQAQQSADTSGATRLDDVVVTATKRATPVRQIPATITVLSGEDLEREGVQGIDQIVTMVPGVNLTDAGQGTAKRITIRGISSDANVNFTAGTLLGDTPFSDPFFPKVQLDPNPFDMATVEVLKGPQGTLFGGSGLNGMIRYVPEAPQMDGFKAKYYAQLNAYPGNGGSGWSYGAMVNAPFADNSAAVRLMAFRRDAPGYIDDDTRNPGKKDVNTMEQYGVRAMLAWNPAENWKVSLLGTTQHTTLDDVSFVGNFNGDLSRTNTPRPSPIEQSYTLGTLGIDRTFDWADLTSQTSYFQKKFDAFLEESRLVAGGKLPVLGAADTDKSDGISQELRLVSAPGDSPWKWLAGAFFYSVNLYDCAELGAAQGLPSLPIPPILQGVIASPCPGNVAKLNGALDAAQFIGDVTVQEKALFGEITRQLGDEWEATLGARAYRTESSGTVRSAGAGYSTSTNGMVQTRDAGMGEKGVSPKGSIVFHPTDEFRAYFTVSRGFRFGGPQLAASDALTKVPPFYKSDTLWNYELGTRSDWFDRSLRLDASVYYIDWKNPQVYELSRDQLINFIDNAGGARGQGIDTSIRYIPPFLPDLSLDTSVSWNQTVTTKPFQSPSGTTVPVGSPWPLAAHWQTSTTLAYKIPIASWLMAASLRHAYLSQACNTIECGAEVFGYSTMDFNLSVGPVSDSYWPQMGLSLTNLTDKRGVSNVSTNGSLGQTVNYIGPRMLMMRLSGNF